VIQGPELHRIRCISRIWWKGGRPPSDLTHRANSFIEGARLASVRWQGPPAVSPSWGRRCRLAPDGRGWGTGNAAG